MWLRLRQIALVAEHLAPAERDLTEVLGIRVCYRDPGVATFGLENALMPIGNQLLEVVAPTREETAAGRYLTRRGGDGGYMVITQCDDHGPRRQRVRDLGIRIVNQFETHEFRNMQLHPKDTGGSFFEIDEQVGPDAHAHDGPWEPAGPDWQAGRVLDRISGIAAAEIQCDDPAAVAARWAEIAEMPVRTNANGVPYLVLDNATLRFVPCTDGRPEGLGGIDVICRNPHAVLAAARARNAVSGPDQVYLCGLRFNLLPETRDKP
jgi:hypothetical protein